MMRLLGPADSAVEVLTDEHKARVVVVANVKLYCGNEPVRWAKRPRVEEDWIGPYTATGGVEWDSTDSDEEWLSDDG